MKAYKAFKNSPRLKELIENGKIILPHSISFYCFDIKIPTKFGNFIVSFSCAPDRSGNQGITPPSTLEFLMKNFEDDIPDDVSQKIYDDLGYYDDIGSFGWDGRQEAPEGGFSEVIDEILRIIDVLALADEQP
jgi:hypothetical protein